MDQYENKLEFLSAYRWRMREVNSLRSRISDLEDQLTAIRGQQITDMPRGGKALGMDDLIARKLDLIAQLHEDLKQAEEAKAEIYACIRSADNIRDRTILAMHYVDGMSYTQIADVFCLSDRQIKRYCRAAIKKLQIPARCP